jgi:hypothetical protein
MRKFANSHGGGRRPEDEVPGGERDAATVASAEGHGQASAERARRQRQDGDGEAGKHGEPPWTAGEE